MLNEFQSIVEPRIEHRIQVMEERNESISQRVGRGDEYIPAEAPNHPPRH